MTLSTTLLSIFPKSLSDFNVLNRNCCISQSFLGLYSVREKGDVRSFTAKSKFIERNVMFVVEEWTFTNAH